MVSGYATCIGSMLNIDGGLLIRNATFHMKIKMDAKIIFHPSPIPEQTMQQNNTFREFHFSYIEKRMYCLPAASSEQRPEIVAVADTSRLLSAPLPDVRVSVHENGCLRSHRRAQPVSKLQCRQIHFLSTHALREAGLPSKDTFVPPPASQVLPAFTRISASASRSKMLLPARPIHQ